MEKVVFTNGCFDLLHPGHVELLTKARRLGSKLIVGLNSDESVRRIKGSPRPFLNQKARAEILGALRVVDEVIIFNENTPARLIEEIKPDVLVKGGDWEIGQIIGADLVLKNGGKVLSIPFESDFSSSKIVEKITTSSLTADFVAENVERSSIETELQDKLEKLQNLVKSEVKNIQVGVDLIENTLKDAKKFFFLSDESSSFIDELFKPEFNGEILNWCFDGSIQEGDLLIAFSMEGTDPKLLETIMQARQKNCRILSITGKDGKKLTSLSDNSVLINSSSIFQIREAFLIIGHLWLAAIKRNLQSTAKI